MNDNKMNESTEEQAIRLEQIRERLNNVTLRPWYANLNDLIGGYCVGTVKAPASSNLRADDVADLLSHENAQFIASAPSDIEYLLNLISGKEEKE